MFGFIVACCLREESHMISLQECLYSVQSFHPNEKYVVIVDFTSKKEFVERVIEQFRNVIFECDTLPIPADMQLLKYYKEKKYFDTAILLQDSMRVKQSFNIEHINDIKYLWHFNNHRIHWSVITEPPTDYNKKHNIHTHDDLIHHIIDSIPIITFSEYCKETYDKKELWSGCFGALCIITSTFLEELDDKTHIIELQLTMTTNRLRRAIETLFALACNYTLNTYITDSYDGLYYDGIRGNNMNGTYIRKISFDRQ
jgi:hypothetical protein